MSLHINANKEDISNIVIMPGDPMRATIIAEKFLTDYKLVNNVRGMTGYTGYYKGKKVSVIPSGMGNPSMGIYSYELFNDYNVDYIIRVGTCGAYNKDIKLYDLFLTDKSYSDSLYATTLGINTDCMESDRRLNDLIIKSANNNLTFGNVHSTDVFYDGDYKKYINYNCLVVEMESFALFTNAMKYGKHAAALFTVSDNLVTKERISVEEREKSTLNMVEIALNATLNL